MQIAAMSKRRRWAPLCACLVCLGAIASGCGLAAEGAGLLAPISSRLALPSGRLASSPPASPRTCDALAPEQEIEARFADGIELVGYQAEEHPAAGNFLVVALYWAASATPSQDYKVFVHLLDRDGKVAAQRDGAPVNGTRPTSKWPAGSRIKDSHIVPLAASFTPGAYRIEIGLYREDSGVRLSLLDDLPVASPDGLLLPASVIVIPPAPASKATSH